ncbi:MAG TPA: TetR family transcriptional regulator [Cellulomonas sp.]
MQVTGARPGRAAPLPPDERRLAILKAVLPVVRTRGTDVTTRELAEAAEVAEGTLFRVFVDKESLVREAVAAALDPTEDIARIGSIDLSLPLEQRVAAALEYGAARVEDITLWMSLMHRLGRGPGGWRGRHDPAAMAEWAARQRSMMAEVRAQIRRLLEPDAHRLRQPVDTVVDLLELTMAGAIAQSANRARQGLGSRSPDPRVLADFFLSGVVRPADTDQQSQP